LIVKLKKSKGIKAVKTINMATSFQLWLNDNQLCGNGIVGKNLESMTPQYCAQTAMFQPKNSNNEFIMQVSNYFSARYEALPRNAFLRLCLIYGGRAWKPEKKLIFTFSRIHILWFVLPCTMNLILDFFYEIIAV
jgi:hypothetical protein